MATTPMPATPVRLELVEGTAAMLPDGTIVHVKGVMYAHLSDSKNLSSCTLVLAHDDATAEVSLSRLHGAPAKGPPKPMEAMGWQFSLEMADPYTQPSRAVVEATRSGLPHAK